ncbi:energy transducer TonB [Parapedobacter tibetensis]|uniref:energy transducer TonB n=1 Tax=Parapedobacter tibetensis TaxID=2972951 RepID=UPI00214D2B7F|nr:energy transducer TonB [Parapedobacter tibetensis]
MLKSLFYLEAQRWVLDALFVCLSMLLAGPLCSRAYAEIGGGVDTTIHTAVEVTPEPFGGKEWYLDQFVKDYRIPKEAIEARAAGLLEINFVVERDGRFSQIEVPRSPGYGTAEEALRLLKKSERWKPGLMNGRPVRVACSFLFRVNSLNGYIRRARIDESDDEVAVEVPPAASNDTVGGETEIYQMVEVMPEPPGGLNAFMQWVGQQYRFPKAAIEANVAGRLQISFVVNHDGKLTDLKVVRDLGYGTGEEAIRVLKTSPRWKPGVQEGRAVRVSYSLPIILSLQ